MGSLYWSLFWYALLYVLSSFAIILTRERELVALLLLSNVFLHYSVNVQWLCLTALWVGLQCVILVLADQTHLLITISSQFLFHEIFSTIYVFTGST